MDRQSDDALTRAGRPRWSGGSGRLEVHYLTATDAATGTGLWVHHELVAPTTGDPYVHGWAALFPPDAAPRCRRFGPAPVDPGAEGWSACGDVEMTATSARGAADELRWDLRWDTDSAPLWTFPQWAWRRQLLPAAQVVPVPTTHVTGTVDGTAYDGTGGVAHIYGHGNAERWVWLHADLGGGDVVEVVAATARRPGLRRLPMLPLVQLRVDGRDWPREPLAVAPAFRAHAQRDRFVVTGIVGTRRLRAAVSLPPERCVVVDYTDPDGDTATCTNTERADAAIRVDRLTPFGWRRQHDWSLAGTAHAEIGTRP